MKKCIVMCFFGLLLCFFCYSEDSADMNLESIDNTFSWDDTKEKVSSIISSSSKYTNVHESEMYDGIEMNTQFEKKPCKLSINFFENKIVSVEYCMDETCFPKANTKEQYFENAEKIRCQFINEYGDVYVSENNEYNEDFGHIYATSYTWKFKNSCSFTFMELYTTERDLFGSSFLADVTYTNDELKTKCDEFLKNKQIEQTRKEEEHLNSIGCVRYKTFEEQVKEKKVTIKKPKDVTFVPLFSDQDISASLVYNCEHGQFDMIIKSCKSLSDFHYIFNTKIMEYNIGDVAQNVTGSFDDETETLKNDKHGFVYKIRIPHCYSPLFSVVQSAEFSYAVNDDRNKKIKVDDFKIMRSIKNLSYMMEIYGLQ